MKTDQKMENPVTRVPKKFLALVAVLSIFLAGMTAAYAQIVTTEEYVSIGGSAFILTGEAAVSSTEIKVGNDGHFHLEVKIADLTSGDTLTSCTISGQFADVSLTAVTVAKSSGQAEFEADFDTGLTELPDSFAITIYIEEVD